MRSRAGQSSVEYLLLMCSLVVVLQVVGLTIARFGREIAASAIDRIAAAALTLASP